MIRLNSLQQGNQMFKFCSAGMDFEHDDRAGVHEDHIEDDFSDDIGTGTLESPVTEHYEVSRDVGTSHLEGMKRLLSRKDKK